MKNDEMNSCENDGVMTPFANWSESLMLSILESANQGIMITNKSGIIVFINKTYRNMFEFFSTMDGEPESYCDHICMNWRRGKFHGQKVNGLQEDNFRAKTLEIVDRSFSEPQVIKLQGDGYLSIDRYISIDSRYIENGCKVFTFSDITHSKLREKELDQARLKSENSLADLNAAIDNTDVGLVLLDRELNTLIVNEAFHVIWNTSANNFPKGTNFRALMDINRDNGIYDVKDKDWEEYIQMRLSEIRAGEIDPREFARADGKILVYSCTALSGGQRLVRYSDITEFKQREETLEEAKLRASSADRSKSEFLANMSHEIRTPMNGVMGMAELLSNTELNSKQKVFTEVILNSSSALLTIINDILDFSKIEAGKLELDCLPFSLVEAIEDIATLVSANIGERDIEMIVRIQPDLCANVIGDVGRFRQILTNLVGNAIKFTEKGHVLVDVSGTIKDETVELKCCVKDTGMGIAEDQIELVFEKFSQIDGSSTRRHEGTGLGLAISNRLVALMGGEIGCESTLHEGSTFWFTANLQIDTNVVIKPVLPVNIADSRLLAIDDNPVNRSILIEQFEHWHLEGDAAASGLEGLAMLRQSFRQNTPYDVIVLDFHMPDMNGLEVARVIRNDEMMKHCAIVMLTSVDNISESAEFKALNINAHLTKPARASQLFDGIIDALRDTKMQANETIVTDTNTSTARLLPAQEMNKEDRHSVTKPLQKTVRLTKAVPDITSTQIKPKPMLKVLKPKNITTNITMISGVQERKSSKPYILVAEDNDVNQMVFRQVLEYLEYDYKIVENGQLAVEEVQSTHPDIVLMDVSMPVMNGLDATKKLRELYDENNLENTYRPTIIGVTAHALKDDKSECLNAGMDDYMPKPISPKKLGEKIKHWLSKGMQAQKLG